MHLHRDRPMSPLCSTRVSRSDLLPLLLFTAKRASSKKKGGKGGDDGAVAAAAALLKYVWGLRACKACRNTFDQCLTPCLFLVSSLPGARRPSGPLYRSNTSAKKNAKTRRPAKSLGNSHRGPERHRRAYANSQRASGLLGWFGKVSVCIRRADSWYKRSV